MSWVDEIEIEKEEKEKLSSWHSAQYYFLDLSSNEYVFLQYNQYGDWLESFQFVRLVTTLIVITNISD